MRSRSRAMLDKSVSAMIAAIETYNKPDFRYREETLYEKEDTDPCSAIAKEFYNSKGLKEADVQAALLSCLYRVGAIGIKTSALDTFVWSYVDQPSVSKGEVKRANQIKVHKMLYRALDISVDKNEMFSGEELD